MIAIFRREIKNYLRHPLFWIGVAIVIYGIFSTTSPYLETHYLKPGERIVNNYPERIRLGDVYEGYIPATQDQKRETWNKKIMETLTDEFEMSESEAQTVINQIEEMDIEEASSYLEKQYKIQNAVFIWEENAYYKGTPEEINAYLDEKLADHSFSFYFSRKFADFAGLFMGFFAAIMLSVLFLQDTRKHTYELLHTKPISARKYVIGKVSAGFGVCFMVLFVLDVLFWILCLVYTRSSGFEVRLWDFFISTVFYILPNMLMIVCVYTLVSLLFKNPIPGVPFLILYMVYSNMGGRNAEGIYGYWGRPLAIMVRFPGQFFDTAPPPMVLLNQSFLILASICIILLSIQIWKRRRL